MKTSTAKKALVGLLALVVTGLLVAVAGHELGQSRDSGNSTKERAGTSVVQGDGVTLRLSPLEEIEFESISIRRVQEKPWGSLEAFQLTPDGLEFSNPAEMTINASALHLPPGTDPGSLRLAYLENGRWKPLESSRYDAATGELKAEIDHFSTYGIIPEAGEINEVGTLFELNGISITASEEVYLRLSVTPELVTASLSAKPGSLVDLTISGLPTTGSHYIYVNNHDTIYPLTGTTTTISVSLDEPQLLWVQPFESTIHIGGSSDECATVGIREGNVCTLTMDIIGEVSIDADDQVLDCADHYIMQDAAWPMTGLGVLIYMKTGVVVRNCNIGIASQGFGTGIMPFHSSDITIHGCDFEDNDSNIALSSTSFSFVYDNTVGGGNARVGISMTDDTHDNEVYENSFIMDLAVKSMGIWHSGGYVVGPEPVLIPVENNLIYDNEVDSQGNGIGFSLSIDNDVYGNDFYAEENELMILDGGWPNRLYHNNFLSDTRKVYSEVPAELSLGGEGNFWNRLCPGPLFIPGTDSNRTDALDSYPYGLEDAWDLGLPPGCGPLDSDGDTVPDDIDNCPDVWNPGQENVDGMGEGDACDITPPDPPVITYPAQGGIYDHEILTVEGTAELRSYVAVYEGDDVVVGGYADDFGAFAFSLTPALSDGPHNLHAISRDAATNTSAPSAYIAFEVNLYPPDPPVIIYPADGEILTVHTLEISGKALPNQFVSVYVDDLYAGDDFCDAFSEFHVTSSFEVDDGDHEIKSQTTDDFGRLSEFSDLVTVTIYTVSEEEPIISSTGKLSITGIADSPDPFQVGTESVSISALASASATDGIGGSSPNHTFTSSYSIVIKDAATGSEVLTLEESVDITDAPVVDGNVQLEHLIEWDGKDDLGAYVPYGQLYTYDLEITTLKTHRNERSMCGREPCVIDEISIGDAGSVSTIEPRAEVSVLFISNGQYPQEGAILEHLEEINAAGDMDHFEIHILRDYMLTADIDLSPTDLIIMTGFAPNISDEGLLNVSSSAKPVMLMETRDLAYAHALGLVTDATCAHAATETVGIPGRENNPVTHIFEGVERIHSSPSPVCGIPSTSIPSDTVTLASLEGGGSAMLTSNTRYMIVSGLHDTTTFTAHGWMLFDQALWFLHPFQVEFDSTGSAIKGMHDWGVLPFLAELRSGSGHSVDSAMSAVWPALFRAGEAFMAASTQQTIRDILVDDMVFAYHTTEQGWPDSLVFFDGGYGTVCDDWRRNLSDNLPETASYDRTESGGVPVVRFTETTPDSMFVDEADTFAIGLTSIPYISSKFGYSVAEYPDAGDAGLSRLLDRNELYEDGSDLIWYWWGTRQPYKLAPYWYDWSYYPYLEIVKTDLYTPPEHEIFLDFRYYHPGQPKTRDNWHCSVRLFACPSGCEIEGNRFSPIIQPSSIPYDDTVVDSCEYDHAFGPFFTYDPTIPDPNDRDGLPNVFTDADPSLVPSEDPLPRMQLVEPSNPYMNSSHPIETYCEDNPLVCQDIRTHRNDFKRHFGLDAPGYDTYYDPVGRISPRRRSEVPWSETDVGPWQVPRLKAGMKTEIQIMIRREPEALPDGARNAFCGASTTGHVIIAWDCDSSGICGGSTLSYHMDCWPRTDVRLPEYHPELQRGQGILYTTRTEGDEYLGITIPEGAGGDARIIFDGEVLVDRAGTVTPQIVRRIFPVYIDPMDVDVATSILDSSMPDCWVGATWKIPYSPDLDTTVPIASRAYLSELVSWLNGGDEGPWVKRVKVGEPDEIVVLFGDVNVDWDCDDDFSCASFNWFDYRGSGSAFKISDYSGDHSFIDEFTTGYNGTGCPPLEPLLHDDDLPWEIVRADGFNSENGTFASGSPPSIHECRETGSETVTVVGGFQFSSQEASGNVYLWFGNVADWGTRFWLNGGDVQTYDPLSKTVISDYLFNYNVDYTPPWSSFIAVWDYDKGIDDLGRSASWYLDEEDKPTKFVVNAAVPVRRLVDHIPGTPADEGILVWHTGRYRASDVYLSYANESDVLFPGRYRHFGGFVSGTPHWVNDEADAMPVIWDDVGELSAFYWGAIGKYAVIYSLNSYGQFGIVMRVASDPWGPFGKVIPLFDCAAAIDEVWGDYIRHPDSNPFKDRHSRWCYGGFTHEELINTDILTDEFSIRFNVSLPAVYKVLLVEATGSISDIL